MEDSVKSVSVQKTPSLLYDEQRTTTDTFFYKINSGGELDVKETGEVVIEFKDKKFHSVRCNSFEVSLREITRNGWRLLAAIERKISDIEHDIARSLTSQTPSVKN